MKVEAAKPEFKPITLTVVIESQALSNEPTRCRTCPECRAKALVETLWKRAWSRFYGGTE